MRRSLQWPLIVVVLAGGVAIGRWATPSAVQGQFLSTSHPIPKELTSYRDIVKDVLPAVVSIEAKAKVKKRQSRQLQPDIDETIPEPFRRFFEQQVPRQPQNQNPNLGFGSGFIVDPSGIVMTNYHVVEDADSVEVTLADGRKFSSSDFKTDQNSDLAIIRIKAEGELPALRFGDSSAMQVGDRVLAVGAPFGLTGSVTEGIISAKGRDLRNPRYEDFLQTDAAVNPGNSGGPLVNLAGEVIGINAAIKTRSGGFEGIALAVSGNIAKSVMQQLVKDGVVKRGYLGIQMARELSADVAARFGLKHGGVVVANVSENSPASKAGLKVDDAITEINGKPIHDNRDLQRAVAQIQIGQTVPMKVIRNGHTMDLSVTIEAQPKDYDVAQPTMRRRGANPNVEVISVPRAGLELADLNEERAQSLGFSRKSGALIASIDPNGPAAEAGLATGLAIVKIDKKPIATAEQAKAALEASDPEKGALVQAVSPVGGTEYVIIKVAKE